MNCTAYRDIAAAHADGVLIGSERAAADTHAESCTVCAALQARSEMVRSLVRERAPRATASQDLQQRIQQALGATGRSHDGSRGGQQVMQGVAAAMAMISLGLFAGPTPSPMQMVAGDVYLAADEAGSFGGSASAISTRHGLEQRGWNAIGSRDGVWGPMRGTMTVYEAADGKRLVLHEMQVPTDFTMPPGGWQVDGRTTYFVDGVVLSLAHSGTTLSCLAARMPTEEFLRRTTG